MANGTTLTSASPKESTLNSSSSSRPKPKLTPAEMAFAGYELPVGEYEQLIDTAPRPQNTETTFSFSGSLELNPQPRTEVPAVFQNAFPEGSLDPKPVVESTPTVDNSAGLNFILNAPVTIEGLNNTIQTLSTVAETGLKVGSEVTDAGKGLLEQALKYGANPKQEKHHEVANKAQSEKVINTAMVEKTPDQHRHDLMFVLGEKDRVFEGALNQGKRISPELQKKFNELMNDPRRLKTANDIHTERMFFIMAVNEDHSTESAPHVQGKAKAGQKANVDNDKSSEGGNVLAGSSGQSVG